MVIFHSYVKLPEGMVWESLMRMAPLLGILKQSPAGYCILWIPQWQRNVPNIIQYLQGGAPNITKLVYNSNNYGLWYL